MVCVGRPKRRTAMNRQKLHELEREIQNPKDELDMLWHWIGRRDEGNGKLQEMFLEDYPYMMERLKIWTS